ncbi:MAG TPA: hypothetical protein VK072_04305 [Candidatus Avamphibacillus sp.]|nr:hypothetical protein [Candidatus Avamphibacillus sp.]
MIDHDVKKLDELTEKVSQHEKTITQLVEIVGLTNRRLAELTQLHYEKKEDSPHHRIISTL